MDHVLLDAFAGRFIGWNCLSLTSSALMFGGLDALDAQEPIFGVRALCQPIPIDEDFGICEHSPVDHLLLVLAAVLVGQLELKDAHVFALKAWLIKRADEFQSSDFLEIGIRNKADPDKVDLLARIGKDESGDVVFWHLGLPWPTCWAA